jgi:hypothetical protein
MDSIEDFKALLQQIDSVLDQYNPGELAPDQIVKEIFIERAKQRPLLEKAAQMTTEGLEKYPFNSELLRRRAYARCSIVTPEGIYPEIELAEKDLRLILSFDPDNLKAGLNLLEEMFTYSGMEDSEIAEIAEEFAVRSEKLLLRSRGLQIKAHGYAGDHTKAEEVYEDSIKLFPNSELLKSAKDDADSMKL